MVTRERYESCGRARRRSGSRGARQAKTLICADSTIGEGQSAALTPTDHGLDGVAEKPACNNAVAQFARASRKDSSSS
jgi:hypothetical protein